MDPLASVLWSGEMQGDSMVIELPLTEEERSTLNIPIYEAVDAKDGEQHEDSDVANQTTGEAESSEDEDSDFSPESGAETDESEIDEPSSSKGKKFFKNEQRSKPKFDMKKIYDFQDKSGEEDEMEEEEVATLKTQKTNNKNGRKWDKLHACKFCEYIGTGKLQYHLLAKHKEEAEVKELKKYVKDPKIRLTKEEKVADKPRQKKLTELLGKIRNDGMHAHNMRLLVHGPQDDKKKGNVMLVKRREARKKDAEEVLHCPTCNICISRHQLAAHIKKTHHVQAGRNCQAQAKACEPVAKSLAADFEEKIMNTLQVGPERLQIRNDSLIIRRGEKLFAAQNWEDQPRHLETVRNRMRELARLVIEVRRFQPKTKTLQELMVPGKYDLIVEATRTLCQYDPRQKTFKKASLAKNLGHNLNKCIQILRGQLIRAEETEELTRLGFFENLMKEWTDDISRHAVRSINLTREMKPLCFPLAKDVHQFARFLKARALEGTQRLDEEVNLANFKFLSETLYLQVTMFNRRRSGEVAHMLQDTYVNRRTEETHEDILASLTDLEKALMKTVTLIKTKGKGGRFVPILLTKPMKSTLDRLCTARLELPEISPKFLFPAQTKLGHVNGTSTFRRLANEADLIKPEFVRARNLRTHVGTMSQILNLGRSGLRIVSKLMGHTVGVHDKFYELPEDTLMVAKASKVLFAMEKGIMTYKGKSLDEIEIRLDEEAEVDEEAEEDGAEEDEDDNEDCPDKDTVTVSSVDDNSRKAKKKEDEENEDEEEDEPKPKRTKVAGKKVASSWTQSQLKSMRRMFLAELSSVGDYAGNMSPIWPKQEKCLKFLQAEGIDRPWKDVKDCIANEMKKKMNKKKPAVKK